MTTKYDSTIVNIDGTQIRAWKVESDSVGNPRYVIHFLDLLPLERIKPEHSLTSELDYNIELFNSLGFKKYRAKWFGGGLVFQSFSLENDLRSALAVIRKEVGK